MIIAINGVQHHIDDATTTVEHLLRARGLDNSPCAVELNRTLLPKREHSRVTLNDGDTIEIVTLVGGG